MHLSQRRLVGTPVRTRSGELLGRLTDILLDTDTGRAAFLLVRGRGMLPAIAGEELRISWSQVISMNEKEIVVTDASVPAQGVSLARAT